MSDYLRLHLKVPDDLHEYLIAELFDMDFEGFEQEEERLIATIPMNRFDDLKREEIERLLAGYGGDSHIESEEVLGEQNWNEEWEKTIRPQQIGSFFVHPTWSQAEVPEDLTELIIDPKLAFGTGYHPTTRLMLHMVSEFTQNGDRVLDAGTGTGILGISALKRGAEEVFGFDIDDWSETNAHENILLNGVSGFEVHKGSVEVIPENSEFDLVLANINRNALAEIMPVLVSHTKKGGVLVLSGLLKEDEAFITNLSSLKDLDQTIKRTEEEWIALGFRK